MNTRLFLLAACLIALTPTAYSAGGGGGGGGGGAGGGGGNEAAAQDPDYQAGIAAAKASDWQTVVARMQASVQRDPKNADAWNELGHAYRMLGDLDNSFKNYQKALQLDPKHRNAREYLGEAYLQVGDLARAEEQLKVLDKLCFLPCEQYTDLKEEIARYKREHPQTAKL